VPSCRAFLAQVIEQALEVGAVLGVGDEERVSHGHVLEVLDQILAGVCAEQAVALCQRILGYLVPLIGVDL